MIPKQYRPWIGRVVGAVGLTIALAGVSPSAAQQNLASWLNVFRPPEWLLDPHRWLFFIGGLGIGYWLFASGDPQRIWNFLKARVQPQPQPSGPTIYPPTIIQHPPPRYTAAEVDRRVEIIDKVITLISDPAPAECAAVFKDANRIRVMLTDEGPDVVRARATAMWDAVSRQELAIRKLAQDYAMLEGAVPQNVIKLDYKQRFQDETEQFTWAVSRLPTPVIDKTTELITTHWLYKYVKGIAQYEAWINDRKTELAAIREGILKALIR